ncbi:DUF4352 domain-containing protein [Streptomyces sp. NPDC006334]|uniref:DUF4352 domain-containing protein n=1 Tax=Streptomyces sp. NPDC006334 TaxID=3156754 RepID=UPI0033B01828
MRTRTLTATALLALALTACGSPDDTVNTTPKSAAPKAEAPSTTASSAPPAEKKAATVGDTLTLKGMEDGEQLDVTLKQWLPTAKGADEFNAPSEGKKWVAAQFELVNTGTKAYADSPQNGTQVADAQGQRFQSYFGEIAAGPQMASDLNLPKGEKALGWILFEVPKNSQIVSAQFAMNSGFSDQTGQWTVK